MPLSKKACLKVAFSASESSFASKWVMDSGRMTSAPSKVDLRSSAGRGRICRGVVGCGILELISLFVWYIRLFGSDSSLVGSWSVSSGAQG